MVANIGPAGVRSLWADMLDDEKHEAVAPSASAAVHRAWADTIDDEEHDAAASAAPTAERRSWADMSDDKENDAADSERAFSRDGQTPVPSGAQSSWIDVVEEEETQADASWLCPGSCLRTSWADLHEEEANDPTNFDWIYDDQFQWWRFTKPERQDSDKTLLNDF